MKGCRNLTDDEIANVFNTLRSKRDKLLFLLGIKSGLRISELLSLRISDIQEFGRVRDTVTVAKRNTKGKQESKTLPLTNSVKAMIEDYLLSLGTYDIKQPLFKSNQSEEAITRIRAHGILKDVFRELGMTGNLSTHAMRKTFAHRVHHAMGEKIEMTQVALGHKSLASTASYIQVSREKVEKAILGLG